jgi:hypothetical protein
MLGKVVKIVETQVVTCSGDNLTLARREASLNFQKFTEATRKLKSLQAKHRRQNRIVASAQRVLDTWDENEWQEHAGDGELADSIKTLRRAIGKDTR